MGVPRHERESWAAAFEVVQALRLRVQMTPAGPLEGHPNRIDLCELNDLDRRLLRDALRVARSLQQRVEMDWVRS
jgi:CBS domain-containing protein